MRIRPVDIDIPKCNPFENDLLDREGTARILTNMLQNLESPYTMSIDGSWGNGKTTFLNMWKQHLIKGKFPVVGFNAWETDFTGNPLVALTSELLENLKSDNNQDDTELKELDSATNNLLKYFSPARIAAGLSLIDFLTTIQADDPLVSTAVGAAAVAATTAATLRGNKEDEPPIAPSDPSTYRETKKAICSFEKTLQNVASKLSKKHNNKPLIISIDELDRCRPSYAIELLEIAKHLFAVDNIVFVLAIDKTQLTHAIKALYGNEFDSIGYLRRFIDLDFRLPDPDRTNFVSQLMDQTMLLQFFENYSGDSWGESHDTQKLLKTFLSLPALSLRQIQQAVYRLGLVLASLDSPTTISYGAIAVLVILKTIDPVTYQRYIQCDMTDREVSDNLFGLPGLKDIRSTKEGALFEALLAMGYCEFALAKDRDPMLGTPSLFHHYCHMLDNPTAFNLSDDDTDTTPPPPPPHERRVLNHLRRHHSMLQTVRSGKPIGFNLTVQRLELFSDELIGDDA